MAPAARAQPRSGTQGRGGFLALGAAVGFAAGVKVFVLPQHPNDGDVAAIAGRVDNRRDAAGQFAAAFVGLVLTTPPAKRGSLNRFLTVSAVMPQQSEREKSCLGRRRCRRD